MTFALGPALLAEPQWRLRDALATVGKTVKVFEDPIGFQSGLPPWEATFLGTYSQASTPYSGGAGPGLAKLLTAAGAGSRAILRATNAGRSVSDGVTTSGSNVVTSATANFMPSDINRTITGTNVPANTIIVGVINATIAVLSQAASGSGTAITFTLGASKAPLIQSITPSIFKAIAWTIDGVTFDADTGFDFFHGFYGQSAGNDGGAFFECLNGKVGGCAAFLDDSATKVTLPRIVTDAVTTAGSTTVTSATANFTSVDVGQPIGNYDQYLQPPVPLIAGAVITAVNSTTSVTISLPATLTESGQTLAIGQQPYFRPFSTNGGGRWHKNFTTLWLPTAGFLYLLRNDQVVAEVDLNPYYGTGAGQLDTSKIVGAQTQLTSQDGSAHYMQWSRTELILVSD